MPQPTLQTAPPKPGQLALLRSHRWLVKDVVTGDLIHGSSPIVTLACTDDDAQGQPLQVHRDCEPGRMVMDEENWAGLAETGFDQPRVFAALMIAHDEGLTKTYTRFHDPEEDNPKILELRTRHPADRPA